jgi:RNA polymerase sigma factor (sigma-70 family)
MANNLRIYLDEDTWLMLQVGKGNAQAFEKIYRKYFPVVTSYFASLNGHLTSPEDLTQEVFVRIWRRRAEYRPNATVKTYLFSYAQNVLREKKSIVFREARLNVSNFSNLTSKLLQTDAVIQNDDIVNSLKKLIARLPYKQRQAFELVYISGFSTAAAAGILQVSPQSVYNNLYRARKQLRKLWAVSKQEIL